MAEPPRTGPLSGSAPLPRERAHSPGRFRFNVKSGRSEEWQGEVTIRTQLQFMPDVEVTGGGHAGGEVVALGTPEQIAAYRRWYTGKFMKAHV
jgi:excinuclease UvrABC ATPase subunit